MDRTNFAGLTRLIPGDALESDGGSFLWRNPTVTDQLLSVGAVTHRHDAHPALANPTGTPSAAVGSGGSLANDLTVYAGYTLVDAYGGETLISPLASAVTSSSLGEVTLEPTVTFDTTGGTLPVGTYYYGVTVLDGSGGETPISPYGEASRDPGYASGRMIVSGLSAILSSVGGSSWRLYRAVDGGGWAYMAAGAGDGFTDDGSVCADATLVPPDSDSTGGTNSVTITIPGQGSGAVTVNVYASPTTTFESPALLASFPRVAGASAVRMTSTALDTGAPPPVSTAKTGANKINALTDVVNLASALTSMGYSSGSTGGGGGGGASALVKHSVGSFPFVFAASAWTNAGGSHLPLRYWTDGTEVHVEGVVKKAGTPTIEEIAFLGVWQEGNQMFDAVIYNLDTFAVVGRVALLMAFEEGTIYLAENPPALPTNWGLSISFRFFKG